jgi:hypothetical protein
VRKDGVARSWWVQETKGVIFMAGYCVEWKKLGYHSLVRVVNTILAKYDKGNRERAGDQGMFRRH